MRIYKVYVDYIVNYKENCIGNIFDYFRYSENNCDDNMHYNLKCRGFHLCQEQFTFMRRDFTPNHRYSFLIDIDFDYTVLSSDRQFIISMFRNKIFGLLREERLKEFDL